MYCYVTSNEAYSTLSTETTIDAERERNITDASTTPANPTESSTFASTSEVFTPDPTSLPPNATVVVTGGSATEEHVTSEESGGETYKCVKVKKNIT